MLACCVIRRADFSNDGQTERLLSKLIILSTVWCGFREIARLWQWPPGNLTLSDTSGMGWSFMRANNIKSVNLSETQQMDLQGILCSMLQYQKGFGKQWMQKHFLNWPYFKKKKRERIIHLMKNIIKHINPNFSGQILYIDYTLTYIAHTPRWNVRLLSNPCNLKWLYARRVSTVCFFQLVPANQYLFPVTSHSSSLQATPVSPHDLYRLLFFPEPLISLANWFCIQLLNHLPSALSHQAKSKSLFHLKISRGFSQPLKTRFRVGSQ